MHTSSLSHTKRVAFESVKIELVILVKEDIEGSINSYRLSRVSGSMSVGICTVRREHGQRAESGEGGPDPAPGRAGY